MLTEPGSAGESSTERAGSSARGGTAPLAPGLIVGLAELVVLTALFGVIQDLIGLIDLLELGGVAVRLVGMELVGLGAEGFLDFLG